MVLTGCLKMNELHQSIRLDVIFLLAGVIPLGLTLERSGGAQLLANLAVQSAGYVSPIIVLGIFYLMAMLLTELISNNATVVVMVPVAVQPRHWGWIPRRLSWPLCSPLQPASLHPWGTKPIQ
jgi:di/tricarboxylate transporter